MALPFEEIKQTEYNVRKFSEELDSSELVWHRDREDRFIVPMHTTDWKFQLDNKLPQDLLDEKLFIPKKTYHRLIKGTGDLTLKVYKL